MKIWNSMEVIGADGKSTNIKNGITTYTDSSSNYVSVNGTNVCCHSLINSEEYESFLNSQFLSISDGEYLTEITDSYVNIYDGENYTNISSNRILNGDAYNNKTLISGDRIQATNGTTHTTASIDGYNIVSCQSYFSNSYVNNLYPRYTDSTIGNSSLSYYAAYINNGYFSSVCSSSATFKCINANYIERIQAPYHYALNVATMTIANYMSLLYSACCVDAMAEATDTTYPYERLKLEYYITGNDESTRTTAINSSHVNLAFGSHIQQLTYGVQSCVPYVDQQNSSNIKIHYSQSFITNNNSLKSMYILYNVVGTNAYLMPASAPTSSAGIGPYFYYAYINSFYSESYANNAAGANVEINLSNIQSNSKVTFIVPGYAAYTLALNGSTTNTIIATSAMKFRDYETN